MQARGLGLDQLVFGGVLTCCQGEPKSICAILVDDIQGVQHIAQSLGHLAPLLILDLQCMRAM